MSRQFRVTRVSDLLIRKEHVPTPTFSGMTEICDDEEGINCATNTEGERCGGHGLGMECRRTCLLCPSLLSHKDVALGVSLQLRPSLAHRTHLQPQVHASILRRVGRIDVDVPLSRLFSPKKPTSCSGLLRTVLTMTASFSRP